MWFTRLVKCYWFLWLFVVAALAGGGLGMRMTVKAAAFKRDANGKSQVYSELPAEDLVASVVKWVGLGEKQIDVSARTIGSEKVLLALVQAAAHAKVRLLLDPTANPKNKGVIPWLRESRFQGEIRWANAGLFEQRVLIDGKMALGGAQPWSPKYVSSDSTSAISGAQEVSKWAAAFEKAWAKGTPIPLSR